MPMQALVEEEPGHEAILCVENYGSCIMQAYADSKCTIPTSYFQYQWVFINHAQLRVI